MTSRSLRRQGPLYTLSPKLVALLRSTPTPHNVLAFSAHVDGGTFSRCFHGFPFGAVIKARLEALAAQFNLTDAQAFKRVR